MVKLSRFAKIRENRESFPPRIFCRIRYVVNLNGLLSTHESKFHIRMHVYS